MQANWESTTCKRHDREELHVSGNFTELVKLQGRSCDHPVQTPCSSQVNKNRLPRITSSQVLSISIDGDSIIFPSNLFQFLMTHITKKFSYVYTVFHAFQFLPTAPSSFPASPHMKDALCLTWAELENSSYVWINVSLSKKKQVRMRLTCTPLIQHEDTLVKVLYKSCIYIFCILFNTCIFCK